MKTIFEQIDRSLVEFWKNHNLIESDFYCRKCNKLLIDTNELANVSVKVNSHNENVFCVNNAIGHGYTESPQNRWCIKGRELSGKTYFRHLCWDCLKKEMINAIEHNDELHLISSSRYPKWRRMLANGKIQKYFDKFPPPPWNSPIWWFKLVFDMTEDELNTERTKFDTASLNSFVKRYGEEEGKKKYDEYCKVQAKAGCTLEYFIEKYGEDLGKLKYDELCKNKAVSLKNCVIKYGKDVGKKFFDQYCAIQSYAGCSLTWFINKLGKEEGLKKYNEVCAKKTLFKTYSNESQHLFKSIDNRLGDFAKDSRWELKNHEFEVFAPIDGVNVLFKLDYFLNGKVIEFNGDLWHANPMLYHENDIIKTFSGEMLCVKDIWHKDAEKKIALEKLGFKVLIVWENEYRNNIYETIDECVKFLRDER